MSFWSFNIDDLKNAERVEIAKWKTKSIHGLPDYDDFCIMENIDSIWAQDGWKTDHIEWKAKASTTITSNVFKYLESQGIDTHFQEQLSDTEILVDKCEMIPLECVFRFVTTWSHYRREKYSKGKEVTPDGTVLETPIMEFFYKHDVYVGDKKIADPLMQTNDGIPELDENGDFILLDPSTGERIEYTEVFKAWTNERLTDEERENDKKVILEHARDIKWQTEWVGQKLKSFYKEADIELLDGKIEFWINKKWKLVVADVIDADSCRMRKPTVLEDEKGNRYLGKDFSREEVQESLEKKYFGPIDDLFKFIWLIDSDTAPYSETLDIIEKVCVSEPKKYKDELSQFIWEDWKIDFDRFKKEVINTWIFRGARKITRQHLQDIARKKWEELEWNYNMKWVFDRNEKGNIIFTEAKKRHAIRFLRQSVESLADYQEWDYSRIVEWEWYDKQGYREWESLDDTKNKYDKLADISSKLLQTFGISGVLDWVRNNASKILNR